MYFSFMVVNIWVMFGKYFQLAFSCYTSRENPLDLTSTRHCFIRNGKTMPSGYDSRKHSRNPLNNFFHRPQWIGKGRFIAPPPQHIQHGTKDQTPRLAVSNIMIRQVIKQPSMPIMFKKMLRRTCPLFVNSLICLLPFWLWFLSTMYLCKQLN